VALLAIAVAAGGCALFRRTPETHYYVLAVPGTPPGRLAAPVRVRAFTIDPAFASERIAYQTAATRLDRYTFHRWAADPRSVVTTAVRDYLERAAPAEGGTPLEVQGHVRRLLEVDRDDGVMAELALDLEVRRGDAVVLRRSWAEREPAAGGSPEAVAAALSRALARVLDAAVAEIAAR
jgi:ABC-type uncharacterized transport system auxiliary subunit